MKNGGDWTDAAAVGFDDDFIYREMAVPFSQRTRPIIQLLHGEAVEPFRLWAAKSDKTEY